jgi:hypothetical protein
MKTTVTLTVGRQVVGDGCSAAVYEDGELVVMDTDQNIVASYPEGDWAKVEVEA